MNFRFKALQRMREPDELDSPTLLAAPRGWIAVFVVLIIMIGAGTWVFAGRLPITLSASGLLTRPGGTAQLQSPYTGVVRHLFVHPADPITSGQRVAEVVSPDGTAQFVRSPFTGQVIDLSVSDGQVVTMGTTVVTVERTDAPNDRLLAMIFVPSDHAVRVAPGDRVDLAVSTAPPGAFGLLRGRVTSIGAYPLTSQALSGLVGGESAAQPYLSGAAPRLIIVDLTPDSHTRSGYAWSTSSGPPVTLRSQVTVKATLNLGSQTPFNLFLGR